MELAYVTVVKSGKPVGRLLGLTPGQRLTEIFFLGYTLLHLSNRTVAVLDTIVVYHICRIWHLLTMLEAMQAFHSS